ncbi:MAG: insulinase family protein [Chloroflexota bacterium]|nr:insulinase family protein [Chloroflexota bacterium]
MEYTRVVLPNGLRVLVAEMPETRSVSITMYVGVGSRAETRANAGISHFIEHMLFKGTAKRPTAADISYAVEALGGSVNASTDREVTVFSARVPARHYLVALDVIADMIRAPLLRESDVTAERNVVIEEIRMYRDQPQDRVHTLVDELLYPRHPLGWEIAGREPVVRSLSAAEMRAFMQAGYAPGRTVIAIAGRLDAGEAIRAVENALGDIAARPGLSFSKAPQPAKARSKVLVKRGEQVHLCIGWRGAPQQHADKWALDMLNAVLGEGMSSRLFLELREKRALAYDVHSYEANYSDVGHLVIYAGVAPDRVTEAVTAALAEVARLRDQTVEDAELGRVRDFVKGRIDLRLEGTAGVAGWLAGQEMFYERIRTVDEIGAIVDSIGPAEIQRVAREYLRPELAYLAAIGPRVAVGPLAAPEPEPMEMAS